MHCSFSQFAFQQFPQNIFPQRVEIFSYLQFAALNKSLKESTEFNNNAHMCDFYLIINCNCREFFGPLCDTKRKNKKHVTRKFSLPDSDSQL